MLGSGIPFSHVLLNSPQTGYLKQKFQSKIRVFFFFLFHQSLQKGISAVFRETKN